jgi:hypothetical protein
MRAVCHPCPGWGHVDRGLHVAGAAAHPHGLDAESGRLGPRGAARALPARHFTAICRRVYRFTTFEMTRKQREAIHSYDEHLRVGAFLKGVYW